MSLRISTFLSTVVLGVVMGGLQIIQEDPVFFRQEGASCFISCRTSGSPAYVHWYQKKDSEPFHEVLYSDHKGSTTHHDQNMKTDFKAKVLRGVFFLEVISAKLSHSATYHCAAWDGVNVKEFGSGTRLFVTVLPVKPPTVTVYSPSRPQQDNVSLVCRASGMSPDYGVFHWKVYEDGGWADVRDTSIVEQHDQDAGVRTSMMVVSKQDVSSKRYGCLVAHEQSSNVKEIRQGEDSGKDDESKTRMEETSGNAEPGATCAPGDEATLTWDQIDGGFKAGLSLNLASLAYTVMVSKCLVYFSLVSTLLLTRKTAREPSVSRRQPGDLQRRK